MGLVALGLVAAARRFAPARLKPELPLRSAAVCCLAGSTATLFFPVSLGVVPFSIGTILLCLAACAAHQQWRSLNRD